MTNRRISRRFRKGQITPKAITIFRKMMELEERCTCPPTDDDRYFKDEQCPACEEWSRHNSALVDELLLKPWEFPAYENPDLDGDYEPDAAAIVRFHALKAASDKATKHTRGQ
jgi:hypothetical protein